MVTAPYRRPRDTAQEGFRTVPTRYVPADSEEEPMDPERDTASTIGRWVGWLVVLALTAAVVVGTLAVVGQVKERPLTRAAATPPVAAPVLGTPASQVAGSLPTVTGRPVAEAQPAIEQAGAVVRVFAAGADPDRPVQPDWLVCTANPTYQGDGAPTGEVQLFALPAGEPCS